MGVWERRRVGFRGGGFGSTVGFRGRSKKSRRFGPFVLRMGLSSATAPQT